MVEIKSEDMQAQDKDAPQLTSEENCSRHDIERLKSEMEFMLTCHHNELKTRFEDWMSLQDDVVESAVTRQRRMEGLVEQLLFATSSSPRVQESQVVPVDSQEKRSEEQSVVRSDSQGHNGREPRHLVSLMPEIQRNSDGNEEITIPVTKDLATSPGTSLSVLPGWVAPQPLGSSPLPVIAVSAPSPANVPHRTALGSPDAKRMLPSSTAAFGHSSTALASSSTNTFGPGGSAIASGQWRRMLEKEQRRKKKKNIRQSEVLTNACKQRIRENQSTVLTLVTSRAYDVFSAILICSNALFVGIEVEHMSQMAIEKSETRSFDQPLVMPGFYDVFQVLFCIVFLGELALRWVAEGTYFLRSADWTWNVFDVVIVAMACLELFMKVLDSSSAFLGNLSALRILRVLRLVRILRVLRVLRFFRELRMMLYSILGSMKSLLWSIMVCCLCFYIFGICMTTGVIEHCEANNLWQSEESRKLIKFFGSLGKSVLTLYQAMSGGVDWGDPFDALRRIGVGYCLLFIFFISFAIFAMMNVVTGVFVESAMESSQHDREVIIMDEQANKAKYMRNMQELFAEMDENGSGSISLEEFMQQLDDDRAISYFDALKLDITEIRVLFNLLDVDQTGAVDIQEFIYGCQKLKGEAKSLDIAVVMQEMKWIMNGLSALADYQEYQFTAMGLPQVPIFSSAPEDCSCPCGSDFMPDSLFCRRCGSRRPVQRADSVTNLDETHSPTPLNTPVAGGSYAKVMP